MTELSEVLAAFGIADDSSVKKIAGGKINITWLVEDHDKRYILQRVNPAFRPGMVDDCAYVLEQLRSDGWDVPTILPTQAGQLSYSNDGIWRLSTFIESDEKLPPLTPDILHECGALLVKLHLSLAKLPTSIPAFLPRYRDTQFHIDYLKTVLPKLTGEALDLAQKTITAFEDQNLQIPAVDVQLIHADPKLNNILFKGGQPYTYIDWDTVMPGSPLIDLGDFARSLTKDFQGKELDPLLAAFCRGYYSVNTLNFSDFDEFFTATLNAAKSITLDNEARYLYNIIDKSLWEWDSSKYSSQEQAMLDEARKAWQIFETLDNK